MYAGHLVPYRFTRRQVGEQDIKIKVAYCGICHSDLHQIRNDWKNSTFPMVPGCVHASRMHAQANSAVLHAVQSGTTAGRGFHGCSYAVHALEQDTGFKLFELAGCQQF